MKMSSSRFAIVCVLLTTILSALYYFTFELVTEKKPNTNYLLMFLFLGILYWLSYHWVIKAMDKSPQKFVNTFMIVSVGRMLFSLIILIPILMLNKNTGLGKFIAIYFLVGYFVFLITEITLLFSISKSKG